jgi:branched-chain amino acid aminotransferase
MNNAAIPYILDGKEGVSANPEELLSGDTLKVYEVIRLINKVPLFAEDHFDRMCDSMEAVGMNMGFKLEDMLAQINNMTKLCGLDNYNVRITEFGRNNGIHTLMHLSSSYYPSKEDFDSGVKTGLLEWDRNNPNLKIVNETYIETVNHAKKQKNVFELLLVNGEHNITEGSKSNMFYIEDRKVFTAPGELVLKGITRKYVMEACRRAGLEVMEKSLEVGNLAKPEAIFLSGTSIKVLPVSSIDEIQYHSSSNTEVKAIAASYQKLLDEYILGHS